MRRRLVAEQITASNLAFVVDEADVDALGAGRRPPVVVDVNGHTVRLRITPMGGRPLIGITKANRALLGLEPGEAYDAELTLDGAERVVEVPAELEAALTADPALRERWDALSHTRRRELAEPLASAKRPETRERRLAAALDALRA